MKLQRWVLQRINQITVISGLLIALGLIGQFTHVDWLFTSAFLIASVIAAVPIVLRALAALKYRTISIELLVSIAVIGALIIGEYNESAIVTFLFLFGSYLEAKTLKKTRQSIKTLTEMAPSTALVLDAKGQVAEVDIDLVDEGDVVLVKTGAQIPVDGEVITGSGNVNEASITGESKLVNRQMGDNVYSGTILDNGTLQVQATKVGEDTTFGKIVELVEEAQDAKSPAEKFIDRFATYYTPAVIVIAAVVYLVSRDFKLAITVLVLGCPGALVIGAPVSNVAGIGNGAKNGVLIKGGEVMTTFKNVDTLVFDKTGTLTKGTTAVTAMKAYGDEYQALQLVAAVESHSDHPLANAIVNYVKDHSQLVDMAVTDTNTIKGKGIMATVAGHDLLVGNQVLLADQAVQLTEQQVTDLTEIQATGSSTVLVAVDGMLTLTIGISDEIRDDVADNIAQFKRLGIQKTVMLTGDNELTAKAVAKQIGIDEVHANLLPEQKVEFVQMLQAQGRQVAFIGDGINDSPSLTTADIGIAMGSGTDVAVETSDIVLMTSQFRELLHAYGLAKKTVANTKENIFIAIATVFFLLVGLIMGYIYMASGMLIHEASILVVIFNAMRLIKYHPQNFR